jgi:hypothetical protein
VTVRSRRTNRSPNVRDSLAREWSYVEYDDLDYRCSGGALVVDPIPMKIDDDYGGEGVRRGFRLMALDDGGLAVGIETVAYGLTGSLFSWGGQSNGSYDAPDKTYWSWSKLARTGAGDVEPAPIDAGRP